MFLPDRIPKELRSIIDWYAIPITCDKCKKISFSGKRCGIDSEQTACSDCMIKCHTCDFSIFNVHPCQNIMAWIQSPDFLKNYENYLEAHHKEFVMNDPMRFYTIGQECGICCKKICYHCN